MRAYRVTGEYGFQQGQQISRVYRSKSVENARKRFIREERPKMSTEMWKRMESNISVADVIPDRLPAFDYFNPP